MKRLIFLAVLFIAIIGVSGVFWLQSSHESESHSHEDVVKYYGPGQGPHSLRISLSQFDEVEDISRGFDDVPLSEGRNYSNVHIDILAKEVVSELAPNVSYWFWTFNETVPGPLVKVKEGDVVNVTLSNHHSSSHVHSIDLHSVNGPGGGAELTQVEPGETKSFEFVASHPGVYVYHCATPNVPTHIANGMYGLIVVEPEGGFSEVDKEFYFMQGEFYTEGPIGEQGYQKFSAEKMMSEDPDYVVFNGRVRNDSDVVVLEKGDRVRAFVGNGGVSLVSSFHIIGEIFDSVYLEGGSSISKNIQTTLIPAGGASIVEFVVDEPGEYVVVDHALARLDKGAWAVFAVED